VEGDGPSSGISRLRVLRSDHGYSPKLGFLGS
jgi:hypothetical protein